ncbi:MAG: hypothetical protein H7246_00365, partial [Phycisphaerae bacterium]|nr:hypothetical protein [Saprospiraceae bacterium]
ISRFSNYRHGLLEFLLANNTSIKVIVDEEPNEDSKSVNATTNAFELLKTFSKTVRIGSKIQMRKVSNLNNVNALIQGELQYKDVHFAVSTENMYRLELDSKLHFAECSFNGKETSNTLINIFDKMFLDQDGLYTMPIN